MLLSGLNTDVRELYANGFFGGCAKDSVEHFVFLQETIGSSSINESKDVFNSAVLFWIGSPLR